MVLPLLIGLLATTSTVVGPVPAGTSANPTMATLLDGVIARDAQTQRELKSMEYDERVHTERLDAKGRVTQHQDLDVIVRPGAAQELQVVSVHGDNLPSDPDEAAREAKGGEAQRRRQTFDLKAISSRFNLALRGESTELGSPAYLISFEPKANQPYASQTDKVLNKLHGRIWVRVSDDTILRTEASLLEPVQVAWFLASVTKLDFHYELLPGGNEYGPAWLETSVQVDAPFIHIAQRQHIDMTHFGPREAPGGSATQPTSSH